MFIFSNWHTVWSAAPQTNIIKIIRNLVGGNGPQASRALKWTEWGVAQCRMGEAGHGGLLVVLSPCTHRGRFCCPERPRQIPSGLLVILSQRQFHSLWSLTETWLLLVENLTQYPVWMTWNIVSLTIFDSLFVDCFHCKRQMNSVICTCYVLFIELLSKLVFCTKLPTVQGTRGRSKK